MLCIFSLRATGGLVILSWQRLAGEGRKQNESGEGCESLEIFKIPTWVGVGGGLGMGGRGRCF